MGGRPPIVSRPAPFVRRIHTPMQPLLARDWRTCQLLVDMLFRAKRQESASGERASSASLPVNPHPRCPFRAQTRCALYVRRVQQDAPLPPFGDAPRLMSYAAICAEKAAPMVSRPPRYVPRIHRPPFAASGLGALTEMGVARSSFRPGGVLSPAPRCGRRPFAPGGRAQRARSDAPGRTTFPPPVARMTRFRSSITSNPVLNPWTP